MSTINNYFKPLKESSKIRIFKINRVYLWKIQYLASTTVNFVKESMLNIPVIQIPNNLSHLRKKILSRKNLKIYVELREFSSNLILLMKNKQVKKKTKTKLVSIKMGKIFTKTRKLTMRKLFIAKMMKNTSFKKIT